MNAEQLAALTVLTFGREELAQKARPVKTISGEYRELAARMIALMDEHSGVGLAAPQIGILERMFVVRFEAAAHVFINPSIIATSHEQIKMEEGCLSLPGIWADVVRPKSITVQAWNERGRAFTLPAEGRLARIIQHETDHLNGILYVDHLSEPKKSRLLLQYEKLRKKNAKKR